MSKLRLCEAERLFLIHGIQQGVRTDGRTMLQYRPIQLQTGLVQHASGSARARLGNTDILTAVKAEIAQPNTGTPDCGRLEFCVHCSANASPQFEGRGGDTLASSLSSCLQMAYAHDSVFDLTQLSIVSGSQCWLLCVDVLILECGGSLYDTVSLSVLSALHSTKLPSLEVVTSDNGNCDIELCDDPFKYVRLSLDNVPVILTVLLLDKECIVDATQEEEACSKAAVMVAVTRAGHVSCITQSGHGSMRPDTIVRATQIAAKLGKQLSDSLCVKLSEQEQADTTHDTARNRGFLA